MWRVRPTALGSDTLRWEVLDASEGVLSFEAVLRDWREGDSFRAFWCASLRDVSFDAYAWECPPVTAASVSRAFECVFVLSPPLARMPPDPDAFAEHFYPGESVATFGNLGGDALLVAPCPGGAGSRYSHLASFVATAPESQQRSLWQAVGLAMEKRLGARPVWLSTAGHGVGWLHVRLDSRPKYYRHEPYRSG